MNPQTRRKSLLVEQGEALQAQKEVIFWLTLSLLMLTVIFGIMGFGGLK